MFRFKRHLTAVACATAALACAAVAPVQASEADTVRFARPAWPGVIVKNEVASQLLESLGYQTRTQQLSPSIILNGIANDRIDVYLSGWIPMEAPLIDPMVEKDRVTKLVANISDGAVQGIAVPTYVWKAGIHSIKDMVAHGDKFDHKIYGIESGSGFNVSVEKAIKQNKAGLGEWDIVPSSTAAMLAQVDHSIQHHEWVAFSGWRPHWMNITYDMKYLKDSDDSGVARIKTSVYTVTRPNYADKNPNLGRFFKQFQVPAHMQSRWIYDFSHEKQKPETVARNWIAKHPKQIAKWLDGVKTVDGKPAKRALDLSND